MQGFSHLEEPEHGPLALGHICLGKLQCAVTSAEGFKAFSNTPGVTLEHEFDNTYRHLREME